MIIIYFSKKWYLSIMLLSLVCSVMLKCYDTYKTIMLEKRLYMYLPFLLPASIISNLEISLHIYLFATVHYTKINNNNNITKNNNNIMNRWTVNKYHRFMDASHIKHFSLPFFFHRRHRHISDDYMVQNSVFTLVFLFIFIVFLDINRSYSIFMLCQHHRR